VSRRRRLFWPTSRSQPRGGGTHPSNDEESGRRLASGSGSSLGRRAQFYTGQSNQRASQRRGVEAHCGNPLPSAPRSPKTTRAPRSSLSTRLRPGSSSRRNAPTIVPHRARTTRASCASSQWRQAPPDERTVRAVHTHAPRPASTATLVVLAHALRDLRASGCRPRLPRGREDNPDACLSRVVTAVQPPSRLPDCDSSA